MELNGKAINKAMMDSLAYGYDVGFDDKGFILIRGGRWHIVCHRDTLPRKTLALLVEHIGYIPNAGAMTVTRAKKEIAVQELFWDSLDGDIRPTSLMLGAGDKEIKRLKDIGLHTPECIIMSTDDGRIVLIDIDKKELFPDGWKDVTYLEDVLVFYDEGMETEVCVHCTSRTRYGETINAGLEALEEVQWFGIREGEGG